MKDLYEIAHKSIRMNLPTRHQPQWDSLTPSAKEHFAHALLLDPRALPSVLTNVTRYILSLH